jgi:hypothetical protein
MKQYLYVQHFRTWVRSLKVLKYQDLEIVCSSNLRAESTPQEKMVEFFKAMYKELLFLYLAKHAFCDAIRSPAPSATVEEHRLILVRIQKPGEYYTLE